MKRIMTEERIEELKIDGNFMKVMLKCYGEALELMAEIVNPLAVVDEPFVCAALEAAACAIKERMDAEPLSIYKLLKETPVVGVSMGIKKAIKKTALAQAVKGFHKNPWLATTYIIQDFCGNVKKGEKI